MGYEVERRLARGGMGVVDLAVGDDGRRVALKRLAVHGTASEMREARARFERELRVLRSLDHEAVVPLLDVLDEDGELVLVMPYLPGGTLAERVRDRGPLPPAEVLALADRLLPALAAAHRAGIVHRDVKPGNVLFDDHDRAHLADFGVARTRDVTQGLTRTDVVLGTPGFLSPEQARGEPLTPASDIASLGATLHYAATGSSPYGGGETPAVLLRTARARARIDRDLPRDLRRLLTSMLDPRPDRRPSAASLARGAAGTDPLPHLGGRRRGPVAVATAAAALTLVTLAAGVSLLDAGDGTERTGTTVTTTPATTGTTEPPCTPLPYQPCGEDPAPNTDGRRCVEDHADYDGLPANGCEAAPDDVDGTELVDELEATVVPADDVDRYVVRIEDGADLGCNSTFHLTLESPPGMSLVVALFDDDGELVGEATSADGVPGDVAVSDPRCFRGDGGDYVAEVRPVGSDRVAEPYRLRRRGSF